MSGKILTEAEFQSWVEAEIERRNQIYAALEKEGIELTEENTKLAFMLLERKKEIAELKARLKELEK